MIIGIHANLNKPSVRDILCPLLEWMAQKRIDVLIRQSLADFLSLSHCHARIVDLEDLVSQSDVILALGGDGTMLAAAREIGAHETPLLGVNLGGLGFLAEIAVENLYANLEQLIDGQYHIQERMVLASQVCKSKNTIEYHALNDVVLNRHGNSRVLNFDVSIDGVYFCTYNADGLIVSTPTGSTAYSLSVGGPIVVPAVDTLILSPICPHTLTARPTVISAASHVHVDMLSEDADSFLSMDGQVNVPIVHGCRIEIKRAQYKLKLITFHDHNYFDLLRKKLQWGALPRK